MSRARLRRVRRCCSDCVGVVGMFVVYRALLKIVFSLRVVKYAVCLCRGCDGCCVFCLYYEGWSCSMSVLSCRYCMFVSCVHSVAALKDAFCMTCSLLMLVEDKRGDHMEKVYFRAVIMTVL